MTLLKYRNSIDFIERAFQSCMENCTDLVKASELLSTNGFHAQSLSISVLALEELGKLISIDGLLFARSDDYKSDRYKKSLKSHHIKLESLVILPMFIGNLAKSDPRYGSDKIFVQATLISIKDLQARGNTLFQLLPNKTFQDLDKLKQQGFYSQPDNNIFKSSREAINPDISSATHQLAWRAVSTLEFIFKGNTLHQYLKLGQKIRANMTQQVLESLQSDALELANEIFELETGDANNALN